MTSPDFTLARPYSMNSLRTMFQYLEGTHEQSTPKDKERFKLEKLSRTRSELAAGNCYSDSIIIRVCEQKNHQRKRKIITLAKSYISNWLERRSRTRQLLGVDGTEQL